MLGLESLVLPSLIVTINEPETHQFLNIYLEIVSMARGLHLSCNVYCLLSIVKVTGDFHHKVFVGVRQMYTHKPPRVPTARSVHVRA